MFLNRENLAKKTKDTNQLADSLLDPLQATKKKLKKQKSEQTLTPKMLQQTVTKLLAQLSVLERDRSKYMQAVQLLPYENNQLMPREAIRRKGKDLELHYDGRYGKNVSHLVMF